MLRWDEGSRASCETFEEIKSMRDLCLSEPYDEIDSSFSCEVLFDDKSLRGSFNECLPSPSKFTRHKSMAYSCMDDKCCSGAIISILKPHKIITVSTEFLNTIEFSSSQICGRSIGVLFGPRTDTSSFTAAIKNTGLCQSATIDTILNTSAGADLRVTASFSPYRRPSDRSLGGCLLQIDCIHHGDESSPEPVLLLDDFTALPDSASPSTRTAQQRRLRREANLAAGRDNEAERRRQQRGRLPPDAAPARA